MAAMLPLKKVEIRRLFEQAAQDYPPQAQIVFLLQSMEDPRNVGSIFRVADAVGAQEIIFTGKTPTPPHEEIDRTSRGHDRRIPWRRIARIDEAIDTLQAEGYQVVALETARGTTCFLDYPYGEKTCLVLGNESGGVYAATLGKCDGAVFIPMYGKGPSMNVHVAAALVAYQALLTPRAGADLANGLASDPAASPASDPSGCPTSGPDSGSGEGVAP